MEKIEEFLRLPESEQKRVAKQGRVADAIDLYLERQNDKEHRRELGVFSASQLGSATGQSLCGRYVVGCGRAMYYRYMYIPPKECLEPDTRRRLDLGTAAHRMVQGYLNEISADSFFRLEQFREEVVINRDTNALAAEIGLHSTTDGVYFVDVWPYCLEFKSIADASFSRLTRPKPEHVTQAIVYMGVLDIPVATILYMALAPKVPFVEYTVTFDKDHWDAVLKKIEYVKGCCKQMQEPKREGGFYCNSCNYSYMCNPPSKRRKPKF